MAYDEFHSYLKECEDEINIAGDIMIYGDLIHRRITHVDKFWYHVQAFFFSVGMINDSMNNRKYNARSTTLRRNLETFSSDDIRDNGYRKKLEYDLCRKVSDSPLLSKSFRNCLTHFDEKLEENYPKFKGKIIIDNDFAVYTDEDKRSCIFVRNYNIDDKSFTFFEKFDKKPYRIAPVIEELKRVRDKCVSEMMTLKR
ncbi:hypothetical protein J41TS12_06160 [Paenibacillus antibioticophila]|uniref:Uncharacterized protein n=1 Tax=Paenibacillus antibioticophila TaxID=1274374 RepID=A0A920CDP0_9BACL|nr:hypothetical protein [Paenibacillus antibioticophila]GIO35755.1 hypothetical protein J41TS12_06160 [Paenibacillus antibioticophila]